VLGAGHVGPAIARVAVATGFPVELAASGDPAKIELVVRVVAPRVEARWAAEAIEDSDIVVLAIPIHKLTTLDPEVIGDRIVVDAMNYLPSYDGVQEMFEGSEVGSSEIVQRWLVRSRVVKSFNHLGYHELEDGRRPAGAPDRRALGAASDDPGALDTVADLIERIGYDVVRLESLRAGHLLEPGGPVFGLPLGRAEFENAMRSEAAT
jgi:predicted dinucleotide-binding enzyme